jgi:uncharacterized protein (TIGR02300 family)
MIALRGNRPADAIDSGDGASQVKHRISPPRIRIVAKTELGTKRLCASCGAKFYDLNKDPIVCPKCDTVFVAAPVSRARPDAAAAATAAAAAAAAARAPALAEAEAPETADAEFVSLEDADAEASGGKAPAEAVEGDEEIEMDESLDDAAFIEEEEEGDEDVSTIIGDVNDEEET